MKKDIKLNLIAEDIGYADYDDENEYTVWIKKESSGHYHYGCKYQLPWLYKDGECIIHKSRIYRWIWG